MYNHELKLISRVVDKDEIGNDVVTEIEKVVLCKIADIGQSEFYNAKVSGLKPNIKFILKSFEYEGEKEVIFRDSKYKVTRTYSIGYEEEGYKNRLRFDEIELTCERVVGYGS